MSIPVMIIPILNREDLLEQALSSIDHPIDEILIINNSGNDNLLHGFKEKFNHLNIRILNLPSNMGVSGSWNLGIKLYPFAQYWVISSADTSFEPGSLAKMEQYSTSDRFIKSNVHYSFFSVGEIIIDTVGLFDEYIYPAYFEDNDFEERMIRKGFGDRILFPQDIFANDNGGSQTIKSDINYANRNHETFVSNQNYYLSKKNSNDFIPRGWNLTRRRFNDWSN